MAARIFRTLVLFIAAVVLPLVPGNAPFTQPSASAETVEAIDGPDASGNGDGGIPVEPSSVVGASSLMWVFTCLSPVSGNQGLTWDGSHLWIADYATKSAHRVNPSTCQSVSSIPLPGTYPTGLAWDGTYLWSADGDTKKIYKLNPSTGAVVSSFNSQGTWPMGLAWDGTNLWNSDTNCKWPECTPDVIYKLSSAGNMLATFNAFGQFPSGLAYDGVNLWHSDNVKDIIYKLNPTTLSILGFFASPNTYPNGLAWDGQYLWVNDNFTDRLYKYDVSNVKWSYTLYLPQIHK